MKKTMYFILSALVAPAPLAMASMNLQFDICPFQTTPDGSDPHFVDNNLAGLNDTTANGHYFGMGTDAHRAEINAAGNGLAVYYNNLSGLYSATADPATSAAAIESYCTTNFTSTGSEPDWVILNEISGSLFPSNSTYRTWLTSTIAILHNTYHHDVIVYAPFTTPGANASTWDSLALNSYIAIEDYLSGSEMKAENFSVSWAAQQYNSARNYYEALGVPAGRLMLGEHFANTVAGTGYGRDGVSETDWDATITARNQAVLDDNFEGFLSYAWDKNGMLISEAEQIHYEETYAATPVLVSELPEPGMSLMLLAALPLAMPRRRRAF